MRRFDADVYRFDWATAIHSSLVVLPDNQLIESLEYIRQFVINKENRNCNLIRGYLPQGLESELIRIKEHNNDFKSFSLALEHLTSDGWCSQQVSYYDKLNKITVKNKNLAARNMHKKAVEKSNNDALSDEAVKNIHSIRELVTRNNSQIKYYAPAEITSEIKPILEEENILLNIS